MTEKKSVLLVGATGETGTSILEALLKDGSFDVSVLTYPASANKPAIQDLRSRGLQVIVGPELTPNPTTNETSCVENLVPLLEGIDTVISAIGPTAQFAQFPLITAAKRAGVKRFVPCGFTTICPPGGVMLIRDDKETVHNEVFKAHLPYTIIDVGFWHQISFPPLPSGKIDYAVALPIDRLYGDGDQNRDAAKKSLLTDWRDVGRFVACIIKDPRTLNKRVVTWADELSQEDIWDVMERFSGEKIPRKYVSSAQVLADLEAALAARAEADPSNPSDLAKHRAVYMQQYIHSRWVRGDNTLVNAKYLGYLDARELYPDFHPISFEDFVKELLAGTARRSYPDQKLG